VAFSRDGRLALSAAGGFEEGPGAPALAPDNTLRVWDGGTGAPLRRLDGFRGGIAAAAFSPDGRLALVAAAGRAAGGAFTPGGDFDLSLWDLRAGRAVRVLKGHRNEVLCLAFSPDGRHAVSGGKDKVVRVWEVGTGRE